MSANGKSTCNTSGTKSEKNVAALVAYCKETQKRVPRTTPENTLSTPAQLHARQQYLKAKNEKEMGMFKFMQVPKEKSRQHRKRKLEEQKNRRDQQENSTTDGPLFLPQTSNEQSLEDIYSKRQKVSNDVVHVDMNPLAEVSNDVVHEDMNPLSEDILAWTRKRKTWHTVREAAMADWEQSRPHIFSAFLKSQILEEICETCDEQAAVWCTDGCGAFCHVCDYEHHKMKPMHVRKATVKYRCFMCSDIAETRCIRCEHDYCNECHSTIDDHDSHAVQPCVGIPVTMNGCWYLVDKFTVGKRETFLRTFNTKCCNKEMALETRAIISVVNFKGKFEDLRIPYGYCESCQRTKDSSLQNVLALNLFPGSPAKQICTGMVFYDMHMLKLIEVMRREDPSLALRAVIQSVQAASMSRDNPLSMLNFYDVYREHSFMQHSVEKLTNEVYTTCPACTDTMLACHFDGNHKLFRYSNSSNEKREPYMGNKFFVSDKDVDACVQKFCSGKSTHPGTCGDSTMQAARSYSKKYKNLDETGTVMACCRHNVLLKGLNMKRGELYAYPLCLQLQLPSHKFMAQDVICQYRPWLEGVANRNPENEDISKLLEQTPFLSVLHAYAHSWHCQVLVGGRYQVGAGMTTGEELEQCHAKLSRAATTTRVMSKARREEELTLLVFSMNKKRINALPQALENRKKKNQKQLAVQQKQLTDLLKKENVTEEQVNYWKSELQSTAKELKGKRKLTSSQIQKQIEILGMAAKRAIGSISDAGSSKAIARLVNTSSTSNTKLSKLIDEYNDANPDKITEDHRKKGVWPWQDRLLPDLTLKRASVDILMKRDRMVEERDILAAEIRSVHRGLMGEVHDLLYRRVTAQTFPFEEGKYSCVLDDESIRVIIALRNVVAYDKSCSLNYATKNDEFVLDNDIPDVTEDGFLQVEDNNKEHRLIQEFDISGSDSE